MSWYYSLLCMCHSAVSKTPLNQLARMSAGSTTSTASTANATLLPVGDVAASLTPVNQPQPLTDVFVPVETIQPG